MVVVLGNHKAFDCRPLWGWLWWEQDRRGADFSGSKETNKIDEVLNNNVILCLFAVVERWLNLEDKQIFGFFVHKGRLSSMNNPHNTYNRRHGFRDQVRGGSIEAKSQESIMGAVETNIKKIREEGRRA